MPVAEHFRKLERVYQDAPINRYFELSYNVYLTRPVSEGRIVAVGKVAHQSRNLIIAEAELRDGEGRHAARGSGGFMRSQVALSPEIGYR